MSDFWTDLAAKIYSRPELVQPRLPARFEPLPEVGPEPDSPASTPEPGPQPQSPVTPPLHLDLPVRQLEETPAQPDHAGGPAEGLPPRLTITEQAAPPPPIEARPQQQRSPVELPPPAVPLPSPTVVPLTRVERVIEQGHAPPPPIERRHASPEPAPVAPVMPLAQPLPAGPESPEMRSATANEPPGHEPPSYEPPSMLIRPQIMPPPVQPVIEQVRPDTPAPLSVQVTIGRVEVRAATPPPASRLASQPSPRFQPPLTLEAYLHRRNGGT